MGHGASANIENKMTMPFRKSLPFLSERASSYAMRNALCAFPDGPGLLDLRFFQFHAKKAERAHHFCIRNLIKIDIAVCFSPAFRAFKPDLLRHVLPRSPFNVQPQRCPTPKGQFLEILLRFPGNSFPNLF